MPFGTGGGGTFFLLLWVGFGMGVRWVYGVLANTPADGFGELVFHGLLIAAPLMLLTEFVIPDVIARIRRARAKHGR